MVADALSSDRLLAVVLLQPGWEEDDEHRPAIHPVACLGKIVADQRLEDGRYNLLLRGLHRIRIQEEISSSKPYRSARVELLLETDLPCFQVAADFRRQLGELVSGWFPGQAAVVEQFRRLLDLDMTVGTLCDIFSFALPLDIALKQQMLQQLDVTQRIQTLLQHLQTCPTLESSPCEAPAIPLNVVPSQTPSSRRFPPEFSHN